MYTDIANNLDAFKIEYPSVIVPIPSASDYKIGFIRRYFIRKTNDVNSTIYEVSQSDYGKYVNNPFWKCDSVKWRISGPLDPTFKPSGEMDDRGVKQSNRAAIALVSNSLPNLKMYLPNILQFYKK